MNTTHKRRQRLPNIEPFSAGKPISIPPEKGPSGANLVVTGLPEAFSVDHLRFIFGRFGKLLKVYVPLHRETRRPRGFAEVNFAKASSAKKAIEELGGAIALTEYKMYAEPLTAQELPNGIAIKNIPAGTEYKVLRNTFKVFGQVTMLDYNQEERSALIQFSDFESTKKALSMYRVTLIKIQYNRFG